MPIYEYQCKNCGYTFEHFQKISDKPPQTCPECEKGQLVKLVSNTSFQLKGTGWYVTDFKDKASKKEKVSSELGGAKKKEDKVKASEKTRASDN